MTVRLDCPGCGAPLEVTLRARPETLSDPTGIAVRVHLEADPITHHCPPAEERAA